MAGNYPDVPSWRMAYDRDGTQMYRISGTTVTQLSAAQVAEMNDEDNGGYALDTATLCVIFPELRDLDAYSIWYTGYAPRDNIEVSTDTTNGLDGTWVSLGAVQSHQGGPIGLRNNIASTTALGIRALRYHGYFWGGTGCTIYAMHLYGERAPGENPDRLEIWHPTLDQRVGPAYFDWGNVARETVATKTFRVKNISPTKTAQAVRVAMETLTDGSPSVVGWHQLSDGTSWLPQVNVGDLGPGQISPVLTLRRDTPANAQLSLWTFRLFAESTVAWV